MAGMVKRFAIMAIALPLAAAGARKISQTIEARRGPTGFSKLLRQAADAAHMGGRKRSRFGRW